MDDLKSFSEWSLTLKGASGSPPTERYINVGKDTYEGNGLRLINAFFRPKVIASKGNVIHQRKAKPKRRYSSSISSKHYFNKNLDNS